MGGGHLNVCDKYISTTNTALPDEMIYANDCDFLTTGERIKQFISKNTDRILIQYNLLVNTDKTENTILERLPGKNAAEKNYGGK